MKSNSLAKAEALTVVGNLLKLVASELPTIIRDILGETGVVSPFAVHIIANKL